MGIKKLKPFLLKKCPEAFSEHFLSHWSGKRMAIDASTLIVSYWKAAFKQIVGMTDVSQNEPDINNVIHIFLRNIISKFMTLLELSITPIVVYDGASPLEKINNEGLKRKDKRMVAAAKLLKMRTGLADVDPKSISESTKKEMRKIHIGK